MRRSAHSTLLPIVRAVVIVTDVHWMLPDVAHCYFNDQTVDRRRWKYILY